jgi:hypothetical protein
MPGNPDAQVDNGPLHHAGRVQGTGDAVEAVRPDSPASPVDVIDVVDARFRPGLEALGCWARQGRPIGAVAAAPASGRLLLAVAPGLADELPALLDWLGWGGVPLDLRGRRVPWDPADPSAPAGRTAPAERLVWLRPPAADRPPLRLDLGGTPTLCRLLDALAVATARALLHAPAGAHPRQARSGPDAPPRLSAQRGPPNGSGPDHMRIRCDRLNCYRLNCYRLSCGPSHRPRGYCPGLGPGR